MMMPLQTFFFCLDLPTGHTHRVDQQAVTSLGLGFAASQTQEGNMDFKKNKKVVNTKCI